jgi:cell fate regulator YaaT (PSP1 superfamily)
MAQAIGVRFRKLGKLYHFDLGDHAGIEPGDYVIVDTKRGRQLGQVIAYIEPDKVYRGRSLRVIERPATPRDLIMQQVWREKELPALITCREKSSELGIRDVKFVKAEYSFDGSWLTFYYNTENKKINLNRLRTALNRTYRTRVELQLIGPRDVAKILGGHGACGTPRCCSTFLTEFSPISIKMAKEQGVSLNPQEITGMCGRLRCCLIYEYEQYVEARKRLPKKGKRVGTRYGEGKVKSILAMRDAVVVDVGGERHEIPREELEPLDELEALQKKAESGCSRHENGGCDCGAR